MLINNLPIILLEFLLLTIVVEVIMSLILKVKNKKDILNIILVNIFTNPMVTSIGIYFNLKYGMSGRNISLIFLELYALFIEGFIYKKVLNYKRINPFVLSFILNLSSFLIGEIINYLWGEWIWKNY